MRAILTQAGHGYLREEVRQLLAHLQELEGFHRVLEVMVSLAQNMRIVAPLHNVPV